MHSNHKQSASYPIKYAAPPGQLQDIESPGKQTPLAVASCYVIGSGALLLECVRLLRQNDFLIEGILTSDESVVQLAEEWEIDCRPADQQNLQQVAESSFDFLFSIVNPHVLKAQVLEAPKRGAINYHDSLLPAYAGMYATFWALLNGERSHGITWHRMSEGIDEGEILEQQTVDIRPDDTSFSLNVRCFEAALYSFKRLLTRLSQPESGQAQIAGRSQDLSARSYYAKDTRPPGSGIISWHQPAETWARLARALTFGTHPNELGTLKIVLNGQYYLVQEAEVIPAVESLRPGTVVRSGGDELEVSTVKDNLLLRGLYTPEGKPADCSLSGDAGVLPGKRLPETDESLRTAAEEWDTRLARHQTYWVKKLQAAEPTPLPLTVKAKSGADGDFRQENIRLPAGSVTDAILAGSPNRRVAGFTALFLAFVARLAGSRRMEIGFRHEAGVQEKGIAKNFFASWVPLELEMPEEENWQNVWAATEKELNTIYKRKTYPRDLVFRHPLLRQREELTEGLTFPVALVVGSEPVSPPPGTLLMLRISPDGREMGWGLSPAVCESYATDLRQRFRIFLDQVNQAPERPLSRVSLLSEGELLRMLQTGKGPVIDYGFDQPVAQLFERIAGQYPAAAAVVCDGRVLSYEALNERANGVAHFLRTRYQVRPDDIVALVADRTEGMIIAILGVLKAGAAYLPLSGDGPVDRGAMILSDSGCRLVLCTRTLEGTAGKMAGPGGVAVEILDTIAGRTDNPAPAAGLHHLAYVLFTSGSTGRPKGVMISHQAYLNTHGSYFQAGPEDRISLSCQYVFDVSVVEIFGALLGGAALYLSPTETVADPLRYAAFLRKHRITQAYLHPMHLDDLSRGLSEDDQVFLKRVLVGVEPIRRRSVQWFIDHGVELWNGYGPTETCIYSTLFRVSNADGLNPEDILPIGRPIGNMETYVVDENCQLLPPGWIGELCIGGKGLSRGYLNRDELTEAVFVDNPFSDAPGDRLYRTGDRVRLLRAGNLVYVGRTDHQIKIRGFRVEPAEIEAVLRRITGAPEVKVVVREPLPGDRRLVAYLAGYQGPSPETEAVRSALRAHLPYYMVPAAFVWLERLPLTPNGKIDRRALPDPVWGGGSKTKVVPPRTPLEKTLSDIWARVLRAGQQSIRDNFFECGGNSLLAGRLVADMGQAIGRSIPISTVFAHPTVESMAAFLEADAGDDQDPLVAVRPEGGSEPLYCVHPLSGDVEYVYRLAQHLPAGRPLYGFRARGLNGTDAPVDNVQEMAGAYVQRLLEHQPEGNYYLAGYSTGGYIAWEMACMLEEMGKSVGALLLFDTHPRQPKPRYKEIALPLALRSMVGFLRSGKIPLAEKWKTIREESPDVWDFVQGLVMRRLNIPQAEHPEAEVAVPMPVQKVIEATTRAHTSYHMRPFNGNVLFFRATENAAKYVEHCDFGWKKFATGRLAIVKVNNSHLRLFQCEESLEVIAGAIEPALAEFARKGV